MQYSEHVYQRLVSLADREAIEFPPESLPPQSAEAAVLIPLWPAEDGRIELALTRRSMGLSSHRGHVSFPGGRREEHDSSLSMTALRETQEELGLSREQIAIMGRLDDVWSFRGYHIVPFVGWLESRPELTPDPREVEEAIIADLEGLKHCATTRRPAGSNRAGTLRYPHASAWDDCYVWGVTADILLELLLWIDGQPSSRGTLRLQMLQRETGG